MDDIAACLKLIQPLIGFNLRLSSDPTDKRVAKIQSLISGKELKLTFKKFYIKAFIHRICHLEDFQALFELREFVRLWHPSDLGEIFCYAISKLIYSSFNIERLIHRHFSSRKEALLWLFLGAHGRYKRNTISLQTPSRKALDLCCYRNGYAPDKDYFEITLSSLQREDRRWILEHIMLHAPEFGVCRFLGAYLFVYFVIGTADLSLDFQEADIMFLTTLRGMCGSRLQELFDVSICCAQEDYGYNNWRRITCCLERSEKYFNEILRPRKEEFNLCRDLRRWKLPEEMTEY
jgi:hypothetical protein